MAGLNVLKLLMLQVTTLVNCPQNPSNKKKGCSKRAHVILASIEDATWNLLEKGEKIAKDAPILTEELNAALHDVRKESKPIVCNFVVISKISCLFLYKGPINLTCKWHSQHCSSSL